MPQIFEVSELHSLIGREVRQTEVARALAHGVRRLAPKHFASLHVTCSDGRERETAEAFRSVVVREFAPGPTTTRAPMRTANLGGRYEWGAAPLSLGHYCAPGDTNVMQVVKLNSHVASVPSEGGPTFGMIERGGSESTCCGALTQYLSGGPGSFVSDMALSFASEGLDRTAMLRDPAVVPPELRLIVAALVQVRLQTRRALLDVLSAPRIPDRVVLLAGVSFNHPTHNTELVVGYYAAAHSVAGEMEVTWTGFDEDPRGLVVEPSTRGVQIKQLDAEGSASIPGTRQARGSVDHRFLPGRTWLANNEHPEPTPSVKAAVKAAVHSLETTLNDPVHPVRSVAIKGVVLAMAETMAVPALLTLFAAGALELHNAWSVERVAYGKADQAEIQALLNRAINGLDTLDAATTERVIRSFERHFA
ncbi:MAG: hypothetical protein P1V81_16150 [Planctomycetota bacterium]|nr:hypothetical protein [Planctomycetota bacterium]